MRTTTLLASLSFAAATLAQAVPEGIAPSESAPEGCEETSKGNFTIGYAPAASKKRASAAENDDGQLILTLQDGILKDGFNRIGSVVANRQFQFDGPPQAGAIYTGGFSVCENKSLAIGGTTRWWRCGSGGFFNLYDEWIGGQCDEIRILIDYIEEPSSSSSSATASATASSASGSSSNSTSTASSGSVSGIPLTSINGTSPTTTLSSFTSAPATPTSGAPDAPPNSTGGAVATRLPRRETFGAVVGILGAALIL